jgi:large subunit ribosomal protein L3
MTAILGRKVGITRWFNEDGTNIPVTVISTPPSVVTQVKTTETDGYAAVQLGFEEIKPRLSTMPVIGHDAKAGTTSKRVHREFRCSSDDEASAFELGATISLESMATTLYVDVTGTSKGKGFQGGMKRHNFRGQQATHGVQRKHRSTGSIGGHSSNLGTGPKIKKGKRMAGHMGSERVTVRSLDVIKSDVEQNLLIVKGPVPGPNGGLLYIKPSSRLYKSKGHAQAAASK